MKKLLLLLLTVIIGAFVTTKIDSSLGVTFDSVSDIFQILHVIIYLLWGALIYVIIARK